MFKHRPQGLESSQSFFYQGLQAQKNWWSTLRFTTGTVENSQFCDFSPVKRGDSIKLPGGRLTGLKMPIAFWKNATGLPPCVCLKTKHGDSNHDIKPLESA